MRPQTDAARPSPPASRATLDAETRPARVLRSQPTGKNKISPKTAPGSPNRYLTIGAVRYPG